MAELKKSKYWQIYGLIHTKNYLRKTLMIYLVNNAKIFRQKLKTEHLKVQVGMFIQYYDINFLFQKPFF